ncbi:MAG: DUF4142 domain-containing protein [Fibrobacteria bacterium]
MKKSQMIMRSTWIGTALGAALCASVSAAPDPISQYPSETSTPPRTAVPVDPNTVPVQPNTSSPSGTGAIVASDPQILAWILAVDSNEITAATAAEKKHLGKKASAFAKMLRTQHSADAAKAGKLAKRLNLTPMADDRVIALRAEGSDALAALSGQDGTDFEKAYIDAMVKGHSGVLETIDSQMIPHAVNEGVKNHLTELRGHVAAHLEQGKRLQDAMASR